MGLVGVALADDGPIDVGAGVLANVAGAWQQVSLGDGSLSISRDWAMPTAAPGGVDLAVIGHC
ncbi:hypothetical protein Tdes44962_MAKER00935 [Teratosphaeria destructans]|uniref:Uncharacterized protein n=1 Tax=Teratosphaeria destructans TaxID=418781 RepID=A0A9W7VYV1_9PEZI|nr:hypothetical protein Tdes44962_MAKER00935 [Teratosphaeria destructans]